MHSRLGLLTAPWPPLDQDYAPRYWYFEVLELLRKFLLTGIGIVLAPGTIAQVVFNVLVVLAAAVVYLTARPYAHASDNTVNVVAQWAMFVQLFAGLLLRVRAEVPDAVFAGGAFDSAAGLGAFIAVVMACVPCVTVAAVAVSQWYAVWQQYTDGLPSDAEVALATSLPMRRKVGLVLGVASLPTSPSHRPGGSGATHGGGGDVKTKHGASASGGGATAIAPSHSGPSRKASTGPEQSSAAVGFITNPMLSTVPVPRQ